MQKEWTQLLNMEDELCGMSTFAIHVEWRIFPHEISTDITNWCLGLSWQPFKKLGIRTGFTLNHFWYNHSTENNNYVDSLIENPVHEIDGVSRNHKMWIGWHVGLLLFWCLSNMNLKYIGLLQEVSVIATFINNFDTNIVFDSIFRFLCSIIKFL